MIFKQWFSTIFWIFAPKIVKILQFLNNVVIFGAKNSNYSGKFLHSKILKNHEFLAEKFKLSIFSFSENWIFGHNFWFSNSVLSFRYKPVIVFEGISYIATWCMLLWANGVGWMQSMEFAYGIATSTEVAYFTYIYAKVSLFTKITLWGKMDLSSD